MTPLPLPSNEAERLAALHRYEILDTEMEAEFDEFTKLAAQICGVPISLVSLIDENRQWFKSKVGLDVSETARELAFCNHVVHDEKYLEVPNALEDDRFQSNPLVTEDPNIRFYAGAPLVTPDSHYLGTLCVIDRVPRELTTEQRTALEILSRKVMTEMELRLTNKNLARSSRLKDEFLANMSHELRTPLNAILGLSEALIEQANDRFTARQLKSINTISTSGQHLLSLINDILDLSKIEAGKMDLNAETLDVKDFCESCLIFIKTQATQKSIQVDFDFNQATPSFEADPRYFKQILVNLLTNAVKFTPEGGRIGLSVSTDEEEHTITFIVSDTGIGISKADQSKLFQSFTQIDSGLARGQEGSGLGLALVAKLTELHGGSVHLESHPGEGSQFTITLPQEDHASSLSEPPPPLPLPKDRRDYDHALIIDDDPTVTDQLERYLGELGIKSVVHPRGDQAMETALEIQPDVILLDIMLPNESGWVALTKLKEHLGTKDIPIIMISVVDDAKKSRALGAVAHFTKPVSREQLANFFQRQPTKESNSSPPFESTALPDAGVVLLAEDNAANRETFGGYLEDRGYRLHYAINGEEAIELAEKIQPDIILMDIQMPKVDGLTAIQAIRSKPEVKDIPIIALTALTMPGDRERCLDAGATEYLSKPVKLKTLASHMEKLIKS